MAYRQIESLREFVLVAQDRMAVEQFVREGDRWIFTEFHEPEQVLRLGSIGCMVRLSEIYEGVPLVSEP